MLRFGCVAVLVAVANLASAQAFPPVGPEFQVDVPSAADVFDPAIAAESDRGYVVVWRSGSSVIGRRFDAGGAPLGAEFTANVMPVSAGPPAVAARAEGGFLVAWPAPDGDGDGIFARRFDAGGQPVGGEIAVNSAIAAGQGRPRVAAGRRGYVVLWTSGPACIPPLCGGVQLRARLFDASATPIREIVVGNALDADVVMTPPGFVVASSQGSAVRAQVFDTAGNLRANTVVASLELGPQITARPMARVAADANGAFTVSWWLYRWFILTGAPPVTYTIDHGTFLRRFDAAGVPLGPELRANVDDPGFQFQGTVAASGQGRVLSVWTSWPQVHCDFGCSPPPPQDGSGAGVYARLFDAQGNDISGELRVNTTTAGDQMRPAVAAAGESSALVVWQGPAGRGIFGQRFGFLLDPVGFEVDIAAHPDANGNGVLEPGERVVIAPAWRNLSGAAQALSSFALLGGPAGPLYETPDNYAEFGFVAHGATASCRDTGNCFLVAASGTRPAAHWDAELTEQVAPVALLGPRVRTVHVGDSFGDVPRSSSFNRFIETVFHHSVMESCAAGAFCPAFAVSRAHMAAYVLRAFRPELAPPACVAGAEQFADVPASHPRCAWIEELARRNVVSGCGNGNYCPQLAVSREALAVYLLVTREGPGYAPPACAVPVFGDVPAASPFCRWVEELARRGIVAGCGNGNYCPTLAVARDQMSVFLTGTFGLLLYTP